ncbi:isopeptide-forming domain-containing fimbrial protein [uncultured Anaerococcus sp.]|uniref:isopeptide-forming domain-containing fimbrial protein n=1 Tax=uncultured Anaerococcus sp. TaxID=293428 RepID=UPI00288C33E3|nr:isopeptide-forming domain-containing fimbrial protein [uncultured Anaerococcus sp.]
MKRKILSLLTAFAMVFGIIAAPFTSASASQPAANAGEKTESVTVHKLLAKNGKTMAEIKSKLDGKYVGSDKYLDNEQEKEIKGLYTDVATEIKGVFFAWQKQVNGEWKYIAKDGKSVATIQDPTAEGFADGVLGGETKANGIEFDTSKLDQSKPTTYRIEEIHSLSSYKSEDGKVLTDKLAVPVEITLPLVNAKGTVKAAHVYPKNTEDKPKIDKNFDKEDNKTGDTVNAKGIVAGDLTTDTANKSLDINLDNNQAEKPTAIKSVGQSVPYKVVTEIPAQTKWATAKWDDKMTEGLTYNKDLTIELKKGEETVKLTADTDYKLTQENNGFVLEFLPAGLKLLNDKPVKQTLTLKYTAKVNDKSVVKVPESNDITFHYGNNPGHGNTPVPNKPDDNGELKATKTWADGKWAKNEKAKFKLVDANTGKDITAEDLVEPADASKKADFDTYKASFDKKYKEQEVGYNNANGGTASWKYLDKNREYKVVETSVTYEEDGQVKTLTGWEAEYAAKGKGETTIKNYLTNNPTPLNPSEPKTVTYGAKFVKTNVEGERLKGAEFVVKNAENKFLTGTAADRTAYEKAQTAFVTAVKAYNEKVKKGETPSADEKANIAKLEKARDAAWNATLQNMNGFTADSKDAQGVLKLTSNELGQFEIAGLKDGSYTLVEVKAPAEYVDATKAKLEFGFTIGKDGEQNVKDIDFGIDDDKVADNAQRIINKKVSIPQTGGIGSLIFIVAGLAIMGGAFIAYRKSQAIA